MDVHQHFQFLAKREGDYRPVKISHTYSLVLMESREEGLRSQVPAGTLRLNVWGTEKKQNLTNHPHSQTPFGGRGSGGALRQG